MFSGEMQEEQQTDEGYGAEWDDWFVDDANPIETKTWWGGALRSLVHFGSLAAAIAAKVAGVTAATNVGVLQEVLLLVQRLMLFLSTLKKITV